MVTIVRNGNCLEFETDKLLFSPESVDKGTLAMLSQIDFHGEEKVLDLGCGYGVVGILAASEMREGQVIMCDISETAVKVAKNNAVRNGFCHIKIFQSDAYEKIADTDFSLILSNPPYHVDFSVAKQFIEGGYRRLRQEGRMVMVVKRLLWYQNKLTAVFGGVKVREAYGYYVLIAEKRKNKNPAKIKRNMSKKLLRKYKKRGAKANNE